MSVFTFTATTTWTCPPGVTSASVECYGAGGGGGVDAEGEGGGGGGAYSKSIKSVTPGFEYTVTVGAGGSPGNAGGDTWFQSTGSVLAKGGSAGATRTGGAGGQSVNGVGTTIFSGGDGGTSTGGTAGGGGGGSSAGTTIDGNDGAANATTTGGAGGTAPTGGFAGGAGGNNTAAGSNGSAPGGGAGGGGAAANAGTGAAGSLILTFGSQVDLFVSSEVSEIEAELEAEDEGTVVDDAYALTVLGTDTLTLSESAVITVIGRDAFQVVTEGSTETESELDAEETVTLSDAEVVIPTVTDSFTVAEDATETEAELAASESWTLGEDPLTEQDGLESDDTFTLTDTGGTIHQSGVDSITSTESYPAGAYTLSATDNSRFQEQKELGPVVTDVFMVSDANAGMILSSVDSFTLSEVSSSEADLAKTESITLADVSNPIGVTAFTSAVKLDDDTFRLSEVGRVIVTSTDSFTATDSSVVIPSVTDTFTATEADGVAGPTSIDVFTLSETYPSQTYNLASTDTFTLSETSRFVSGKPVSGATVLGEA